MFRLDMDAIRKSADAGWLMANLAIPANDEAIHGNQEPQISQEPPELATLAGIAISQQVSQESAELLTARLIAAAMRACDHHGDSKAQRQEMERDCLSVPLPDRAELLKHFNATYPAEDPASGGTE